VLAEPALARPVRRRRTFAPVGAEHDEFDADEAQATAGLRFVDQRLGFARLEHASGTRPGKM
jgi:hypothetical protein